jgi:hypothetical protein
MMLIEETNDFGMPKVRFTRWMHGDRYAVAFEVEALEAPGDSEASLGPDVRRFLSEARRRLDAGDIDWLRARGKVYVALDEAA